MDFSKKLETYFKKVGLPMDIKRRIPSGDDETFYGILQPLFYKNKLYVELQPSAVGSLDDGCCLFFGAASINLAADNIIICLDKEYVVQRCEKFYLYGKPLYTWAVFRPCVKGG